MIILTTVIILVKQYFNIKTATHDATVHSIIKSRNRLLDIQQPTGVVNQCMTYAITNKKLTLVKPKCKLDNFVLLNAQTFLIAINCMIMHRVTCACQLI